jgi:hypothetical protein
MVEILAVFLRVEIGFLLGALVLIVVLQSLTGKINLAGMLDDGETGNISPARVQLLAATFLGALLYLGAAMQSPPGQLPAVPESVLLLVGGSNLVYLGLKSFVRGG